MVESGRWIELEDAFSDSKDGGNSHSQRLPHYRGMLRVFKPLWRGAVRGHRYELSQEELVKVLTAFPS